MLLNKNSKVLIYAQDAFNSDISKTALGVMRYGEYDVVGIVDKSLSSKYANDFFKDLKKIPIFSSVKDAKQNIPEADILLIGIAPAGGKLPLEWINELKDSLTLGLNIVNGLHEFLNEIIELKILAEKNSLQIWDVRKWNGEKKIATGKLIDFNSNNIVLTVGTDGAIGKMTTSLELTKAALKKNIKAKFVATGQTGIMIAGEGIPLDAITGDFMAGAVEDEVIKGIEEKYQLLFVEGQGSILHPGWSGVTLALLHGAVPQKLILCHKVGLEFLKGSRVKFTSLKDYIELYEHLSLPIRKAKVVGICLNTSNLAEEDAKKLIIKTENELNLPVDDVFKYKGDKLLNACLN